MKLLVLVQCLCRNAGWGIEDKLENSLAVSQAITEAIVFSYIWVVTRPCQEIRMQVTYEVIMKSLRYRQK